MDEPRRHRWYLLLLALLAIATVPFPFVGRELRLFWGLPLWLWWSFGAITCLSLTTAWGILRLWTRDIDPD